MSIETARVTAQRVVDRLLGEDHASQDDFNKRPGGKDDPFRQGGGGPMKFGKGAFSGKRSEESKPDDEKDEKEEKKHPRFGLKFQKETVAEGKGMGVKKAWKSGKKSSGKSVAGKPGKVSYRESLMRSVLEKLKQKKAAKGKAVASAPGKVSYKKEDGNRTRDLPLAEKMGSGSGIKGGKAKKMLNSIAKRPGGVGYGKK